MNINTPISRNGTLSERVVRCTDLRRDLYAAMNDVQLPHNAARHRANHFIDHAAKYADYIPQALARGHFDMAKELADLALDLFETARKEIAGGLG